MAKIFPLTLIALGIISLAACQPGAPPLSLADTAWILTKLNGSAPLEGTSVSARFEADGKVSGSDGCNRYTTTYTIDGNKIKFGEGAASTLMACPQPIMEQASAYMRALQSAVTYEINTDTLILRDANGVTVAAFSAQSNELAGTSWQVMNYNNGKQAVVSLINGTEITASFGEDGRVTGSAGCNNYFAAYGTQEGNISISGAGATRMFCAEPQGIMEQESAYLTALQSVATYQIEADRMEMRTTEDALAISFVRTSNP